MDGKIIEEFKRDFLAVKEKGWIPSNRLHDTGIGKTFEDFMKVVENNKSSADYKGVIELKSSRELSQSMITLFTKSPNPRGVNSKLREMFGYYDEEFKEVRILHTTFSGDKFNSCVEKYCFGLEIDKQNERVNIRIKKIDTNNFENIEAYYPFENLKKKIIDKCQNIAIIDASSKKEGDIESFKFNKVILLTGLSLDGFLLALSEGKIKYDIRLGVYSSGKNKGKKHDYGSAFRIHKSDLKKVFKIEEI